MKNLLLALLLISSVASATTRDRNQVYKFRSTHPCPSTGLNHGACRGYVVDHIIALRCGGADRPFNMQWQTVAAAKLKDVTERKCSTTVAVK